MRFAGIDIGSRTIELVVDGSGQISSDLQTDTGFDPITEAKKMKDGFRFDRIMATGYGRNLFEIAFDALTVTEIKAHAKGARAFFPKIKAVLDIGGHSIEDREIKYGLSVTGMIHPKRVLAKKNLRPADCLVLTKPLGTGIVNTAIKGDMVSEQLSEKVTRLMATLNRDAAKIMADFDIIACTDVTGYGLLGHLIGNCDSMSSVHPHPATETHLDAKKIMVMCASDRLGFGSIWISE